MHGVQLARDLNECGPPLRASLDYATGGWQDIRQARLFVPGHQVVRVKYDVSENLVFVPTPTAGPTRIGRVVPPLMACTRLARAEEQHGSRGHGGVSPEPLQRFSSARVGCVISSRNLAWLG